MLKIIERTGKRNENLAPDRIRKPYSYVLTFDNIDCKPSWLKSTGIYWLDCEPRKRKRGKYEIIIIGRVLHKSDIAPIYDYLKICVEEMKLYWNIIGWTVKLDTQMDTNKKTHKTDKNNENTSKLDGYDSWATINYDYAFSSSSELKAYFIGWLFLPFTRSIRTQMQYAPYTSYDHFTHTNTADWLLLKFVNRISSCE